MSIMIDGVYPERSPAIGDKFEPEAEEPRAMREKGGRKDLEDNVEILRPQFLGELSRILGGHECAWQAPELDSLAPPHSFTSSKAPDFPLKLSCNNTEIQASLVVVQNCLL
jgi:hypothetical protein